MRTVTIDADDAERVIKERKAWEVLAWVSLALNIIFIAVIIAR